MTGDHVVLVGGHADSDEVLNGAKATCINAQPRAEGTQVSSLWLSYPSYLKIHLNFFEKLG